MHFDRDGIRFHYRDEGDGVPFVYQHGLGGDLAQPWGFFEGGHDGIRLLSMDCRAHGDTRPVGPEDKIGIASFADDVVAFMDERGIERAVAGGISMGAAVALNIALRYPNRVCALVLQRPAWLDQPMPGHLRVLVYIGELIQRHGARRGREIFRASPEYTALLRDSPDVAASCLGQFDHPRAEETVVKLLRIPRDAPCGNRAWTSIRVPTLVLANRMDPVHPFEYGEILAREIPGAVFQEVAPKSVGIERHTQEVRETIGQFVRSLALSF